MEPKVSEFLYLLGPASQAEEIRIEMAEETLYDEDLLNMVKDLEEFLEDRVDVNHHIFVPAGHGDFMIKKASVSKACQQDPLHIGGLQQATRHGKNLYYKR